MNLETVIIADTVKRIQRWAFNVCWNLSYVRLSKNLQYIEYEAFSCCKSLGSIFIPPSCREIGYMAFECEKLIILRVPQHTNLGTQVIRWTALIDASPFELDGYGSYYDHDTNVNEWIKNINQHEEFALHRVCASTEPSKDNIYEIIKRQGLPSIQIKNKIGVTVFEYLHKNPYTDIELDEQKLINRYVLELMGEIIA